MIAIVCEAGKDATVQEIAPGLKSLQALVGGCIDAVRFTDAIVAYVNDEGLLLALPWNRRIGDAWLAGTIVVVGSTDEGEDRSLRPEEQAYMLHLLNEGCERLEPTPSSVEELEERTGRPAMQIFFED